MSRKTNRILDVGAIAISDHARLRLRSLAGADAVGPCIRHVQAEWARIRRKPGHAIYCRLEIGSLVLSLVMGGRGSVLAVIVTPVEAAVILARSIDPNAPGEVSTFRRILGDDVRRNGVTSQQTLHQWVTAHLIRVAPELIDDAVLAVALPKRHTKRTSTGSYQAERWFWNVREQSEFLLLVGLARPPLDQASIEIEECFRVPRSAVGDRKVLARYRVKRANRTGGFLDEWRVRVKAPASPSAPATGLESTHQPPRGDS